MSNNEQMNLKLAKLTDQYIKDLGDESLASIVHGGYALAVGVISGRSMPTPETPIQTLMKSCAEMMLKDAGFQKPLAHQGHPGVANALQGQAVHTNG